MQEMNNALNPRHVLEKFKSATKYLITASKGEGDRISEDAQATAHMLNQISGNLEQVLVSHPASNPSQTEARIEIKLESKDIQSIENNTDLSTIVRVKTTKPVIEKLQELNNKNLIKSDFVLATLSNFHKHQYQAKLTLADNIPGFSTKVFDVII